MSALTETGGTGWPFWAPSDAGAVETALDLAGLRRGERLVDLGCGDGQVLVAAGRRGARVLGVEIDPDLAEHARQALAAADVQGQVLLADLFELDLEADVVFSYLAPATLQRLTPSLRRLVGARLVTVDFDVPDLVADEVSGSARLYCLPGSGRGRVEVGWGHPGALVITANDVETLSIFELGHPGGEVALTASPALTEVASFRSGLDTAWPGQPVAVDVRWGEAGAGVLATGELHVRGLDPFHLTVAFSDDDIDHEVWDLSEEGVANLQRALAWPRPPRTAAELLAAAEG